MRSCYFAGVAAVTLIASVGASLTTAQAREYPFCIKGESWPTPVGDCSFQTIQQCQATASGHGAAFCDVNPFFEKQSSQAGIASSKKRNRPSYKA
jgi:hypothetical protein